MTIEFQDRNTKDNVTVIVVNLGWAVEVNSETATADIESLSPAFVQFLQKTELLPSVEEFRSSAVRGLTEVFDVLCFCFECVCQGRISSPVIRHAGKKDFYIRKVEEKKRGGKKKNFFDP